MGNNNSQLVEPVKTSVYKSEGNLKIRDGYYKNKQGVFYNGKLIINNKFIFKKLKYGYAKSKSFVFYKGEIIPDANPQTFIVINRKSMPEDFKNLNSVIGMDFQNSTKRIYQFGKIIYTIKIDE